jgi:hypothetical protein
LYGGGGYDHGDCDDYRDPIGDGLVDGESDYDRYWQFLHVNLEFDEYGYEWHGIGDFTEGEREYTCRY